MLVSVALIGFVSVFDKLAIGNTFPRNDLFALITENLLIVICFLPWVISKRKEVYLQVVSNKKIILLLGALGAGSNLLSFLALGVGNAGAVTSIFRTQIFFVILFSFIFFKDRPKIETILGSIILIAGIVLLKLAVN